MSHMPPLLTQLAAAGRGLLRVLAAGLVLALPAAGCSSGTPPTIPAGSTTTPGATPETMMWNFAPRAMVLHIKADTQLNFADDQSHTLRMCVYQVDKLDAFNELASTAEGLATLMQCRSFDKSVMDVQSQIVTPGQVETQMLDRAEGAK
ncbi:MAG: type VI secretion lipoprotein TssJ, partial [Desulfovibrionaceae bacterium]|nr:type VI secretion lipoprotein TssJ [Desulfovibrionaceae bacterium]